MSLNAFTSAISNGLARKNRYRVTLTGNGPTIAGGFSEELGLMCESIEFPGQNLMSEPDILRNGPPRESVTQATYGSVNATFICSEDMREKRYFERWQEYVISMHSWEPGFYKDYIGDMTIYSLSRVGDEPTYGIEIFEVYPKTLTAQSVGNAEMDSYQTIEVEFMFHTWKPLAEMEKKKGVPFSFHSGLLVRLEQGLKNKLRRKSEQLYQRQLHQGLVN